MDYNIGVPLYGIRISESQLNINWIDIFLAPNYGALSPPPFPRLLEIKFFSLETK